MEKQSESRTGGQKADTFFYAMLYASFFAFLFYFWAGRYRDFLFMSQEYDLFLWRWSFVTDSFSRLAGGANWLASFFIQFFYFPALGAVILAGFGVFITYATGKLFHLRGWSQPLSFLPTLTLLVQITCINYYVFERIDVAYVYSFTLKIAYMLALALIVAKISTRRLRLTVFIVAFLSTYPVFGFFALFAAFLCLLNEWARVAYETPDESSVIDVQCENTLQRQELSEKKGAEPKRKGKNRDKSKARLKIETKKPTARTQRQRASERTLIIALGLLASPLGFWPIYKNVVPNLNAMYTAGLWEESTLVAGRDPSTNFLLTLATLALVVILGVFCLANATGRKARPKEKKEVQSIFAKATCFLIVVALCALATKLSYNSVNFRTTLAVARALDKGDWERIVQLEARVPAPINPLINARNLALARLGRLADLVFTRPQAPKSSPQLQAVSSFGICGDRILYESGLTNPAERCAFNNYVTKRDHSKWAIKTLALCAIADGRYALAERYLYRLRGTLFNDGFVDLARDYIESVSEEPILYSRYLGVKRQPSNEARERFLQQLEEVRKRAPITDELASSDTVNHALYGAIQNDDLSQRDRGEQENRLAFLLVMRHMQTFAKYLDLYLADVDNIPKLPRYLQEATLLRSDYPQFFGEPEGAVKETPDRRLFNETTLNDYQKVKTILNDTTLTDQMKYEQMRQKFADTLWFFYFFPDNPQYY